MKGIVKKPNSEILTLTQRITQIYLFIYLFNFANKHAIYKHAKTQIF